MNATTHTVFGTQRHVHYLFSAVALLTVTRAVTGTWAPFIQPAPAAALVVAAAALTAGAVMIPFRVMSRREPALAPS